MRSLTPAVLVLLTACGPGEEIPPDLPSDDPADDDCSGDVERVEGVELTLQGVVQDRAGRPVEEATVRFFDRVAVPAGDLARATTGADGGFELYTDEATAWPGCWAVLSDYRLVAREGDREADLPITRQVGEAWIRDEDTVVFDDPVVVR